MLHASNKGAVVATVRGASIDVAKAIEGLEPNEINDAALTAEVYPADATPAPVPVKKVAGPGGARGGRKLVSRKKPEAAE